MPNGTSELPKRNAQITEEIKVLRRIVSTLAWQKEVIEERIDDLTWREPEKGFADYFYADHWHRNRRGIEEIYRQLMRDNSRTEN